MMEAISLALFVILLLGGIWAASWFIAGTIGFWKNIFISLNIIREDGKWFFQNADNRFDNRQLLDDDEEDSLPVSDVVAADDLFSFVTTQVKQDQTCPHCGQKIVIRCIIEKPFDGEVETSIKEQ